MRDFRQNKSGFSIIVAILMSAFLIVISMGVLDLIMGERRITRAVSDTISTYAWAEWSLELALLKVKNHREGFKDEIAFSATDSKILASNPVSLAPRDQQIAYTMDTRSNDYSGSTTGSGEFVVIPLFYDDGGTNVENTNDLVLSGSNDLVWNIIGNKNDPSGDTEGVVGTGSIASNTKWRQKKVQPDGTDFAISYDDTVDIANFITQHTDNYLILFSESPTTFHISCNSSSFFSLPKTSVTASARIGDFTQNILFTEDKSRIFDALKYSVFDN